MSPSLKLSLPNQAAPVRRPGLLEPWTVADIYHRQYQQVDPHDPVSLSTVAYRVSYLVLDFFELLNAVNINDPQYFVSMSADRMKTMSSCGHSSFCGYSPFFF
jgi:hypothetical protein